MDESKIEKSKEKEEEIKEEKEKEISVAEKGELPPIFMTYRDNDLFKEWIPKVAETLKGLGRKVEIQSFPAGTKEEEIEKWIREHKKIFKGKELIADRTVSYFLSEKEELRAAEVRDQYLDELFEDAVQEAILGKEVKEIESHDSMWGEMEESKEGYIEIIKRILENKENMPKKVWILSRAIRDHVSRALREKLDPKLEETIREVYRKGGQEKRAEFKRKDKLYIESELDIARMFKKWISEGGIPTKAIECKRHLEDIAEEFDKRGTWIVVDRHYSELRELEHRLSLQDIHSATVLQLPIGNFYEDVRKADLIKFNEEELRKALGEKLEKDFGEKPEEK